VALEVEGGLWIAGGHARGSGVKRDMEKQNYAAMLGWRILRIEPKDLCMMPTVEMIKQAITFKL
jgi:very-short-patch-repair endonuclease